MYIEHSVPQEPLNRETELARTTVGSSIKNSGVNGERAWCLICYHQLQLISANFPYCCICSIPSNIFKALKCGAAFQLSLFNCWYMRCECTGLSHIRTRSACIVPKSHPFRSPHYPLFYILDPDATPTRSDPVFSFRHTDRISQVENVH